VKRGRRRRVRVEYVRVTVNIPRDWYEENRERLYRILAKEGYRTLSDYINEVLRKLVKEKGG